MSLKFAALASLTALSARGTPTRADDHALNWGSVRPHEFILTTFRRRSSAAELEKPEAVGRVTKGEERGAPTSAPRQKISA